MDLTDFQRRVRTDIDALLDRLVAVLDHCDPESAAVVRRHRQHCSDHVVLRLSASSARGYVTSTARWMTWVEGTRHPTSPVSPEAIGRYVSDVLVVALGQHSIASYAWKLHTLLTHLGLLREEHREPLRAIGQHFQKPRQGLRPTHVVPDDFLERIAACMNPRSVRDARDFALLTLLSETLARPAEILGQKDRGTWIIAPIHCEDLTRCADGSGRLRLQRAVARGDRTNTPLYVSPPAMAAIDRWLELSGVTGGVLFRQTRRDGPVAADAPPVGIRHLKQSFDRLRRRAGYTTRYTPSGLRARTVNQMLAAGLHLEDIRRGLRAATMHSVVRLHTAERQSGSTSEVLLRFQALRTKAKARVEAPADPQLTLTF